jgi:uncharacterized protein YdiU (UPF0061 family)
MTIDVAFDTSFLALPASLHARVAPTPVASPTLVRLNTALAETLGLDPAALASPAGVAMLAGNLVPPGAASIATAYAGHQFGHFVPQLGDGRAILLGEVVGRDGVRRDIQLKGAGRTPFSRGGDGRAALGPVLREYLISEAMAALGVPTTRALAAVATGEYVFRETPLPGAVLTRVAASHLRVGTFQFAAARGDLAALRALADHAIARHDPDAAGAAEPYRALLAGVVARQAALVARWLLIGFIHGVMNTDNTSISGETIDFGPCAFMDTYDPATVFSSIDQSGRYAYANQPRIAQWNLARLAEALLPLLAPDVDAAIAIAGEVLDGFSGQFNAAYVGGLLRKIGLATEQEGDVALVQDLLDAMSEAGADFTLVFRNLCRAAEESGHDAVVRALFAEAARYDAWAARWRQRLAREGGAPADTMRAVNPAVIPRNHMVEAALAAAVERRDFAPFERLLEAVARPYEERAEYAAFAVPPRPEERVRATFCGT